MQFTVVLQRPDYLDTDVPRGTDTYVALVESENYYEAVRVARKEVYKADKKDELNPERPEDYALSCVFAGHQKCLLWGWQL